MQLCRALLAVQPSSYAAIRAASFFVCGAARSAVSCAASAAANGASCRVRMRGWPCQAAGRVAVQPVPFGSDFFSVVLFVFQCRSTVLLRCFRVHRRPEAYSLPHGGEGDQASANARCTDAALM